jgi:hypothetical protein
LSHLPGRVGRRGPSPAGIGWAPQDYIYNLRHKAQRAVLLERHFMDTASVVHAVIEDK